MQPKRRGRKFVALLFLVALFLILEIIAGYVQKSLRPKFATPQEVAEYVYKRDPEAIILGKDSCFIFNRFYDREAEYMISPCVDGKYEIRTSVQSNLIIGNSISLQNINFLQIKGSNDQYIVVVGMGYPGKISVCDDKGTDFHLFFYEKQVEGTEYAPYFWAVGYLDSDDLSSYTVTVNDSHTSESISVTQQGDGSFK